MGKIYIGKIVNTHGIKGELRVLSDFLYKDNSSIHFLVLFSPYSSNNFLYS